MTPTREEVERPTTLGACGSKWVRLTDYEALAAENTTLREGLDAEWNAAIEALRKAVIARFEISPITVERTTVYGHGPILAAPLLHEIDALRRNPKEGV